MKTAVLIHGFHLGSSLSIKLEDGTTRECGWQELAIGVVGPYGATGRATHGVLLAYAEQADLVIFSTGASSKDGLSEARYTYRAVMEQSANLASALGINHYTLEVWLRRRVEIDETSQNTQEELDRNLKLCTELGIHRIILVTNRFHAPRALDNANAARQRLGLGGMTIMASASLDPSPGPTIFEPATRPDRPSLPWNELLSGVFKLPPDRQAEAFEKIAAALKN